jgi:DNA-binding NtrC family response regulator
VEHNKREFIVGDGKLKSILIVDDDIKIRNSLKMILSKDFKVFLASNAQEAFLKIQEHSPDIILLDTILPDLDSLKVLERIKQIAPNIIIIIITATKTTEKAAEAMKHGAFDFVFKPIDIDELQLIISRSLSKKALEQELKYRREETEKNLDFGNVIISKSKAMKEIFQMAKRIADLKSPVLIMGENKIENELLAKAIHRNSQRASSPFVVVNSSTIPTELLIIELFGHEKGAFTGAEKRKVGSFEMAHQGTLFLDPIDELSLPAQAKVLKFLEEKVFNRVGGTESIKADVRLITATNKHLSQLIKVGNFREDLYYKINIVPILMPPLKKRKEDIPLMVDRIISKFNVENNKNVKGFDQEALELLMQYEWPGNYRELESVIEHVIALTSNDYIQVNELPLSLKNIPTNKGLKESVLSGKVSFLQAVEEFEKEMILDALKKNNYNQSHASDLLGISRRILKYKMDKLGIINNHLND